MVFVGTRVMPGSPTGAEVTGAPEGRKGGKEPTESWMDNGRILQPFWSLGNYGNLVTQKKKSPAFERKNRRAD